LTVSRFHAKVCILRFYAGVKRGKKGDLFPKFRILIPPPPPAHVVRFPDTELYTASVLTTQTLPKNKATNAEFSGSKQTDKRSMT
jgi:hypothetical protein